MDSKEAVIFKMLTFHGLLKPDREQANEIVRQVWFEDLSPFTGQDINEAWKRTRTRVKWFSLPELVEDLLVVHQESSTRLAEGQLHLIEKYINSETELEDFDVIGQEVIKGFPSMRGMPTMAKVVEKTFVEFYVKIASTVVTTRFASAIEQKQLKEGN